MTSNPTRTSPVKRGKWVLEQLLGTPPPPPPPNVPTLKEDQKALTAATVRLRMEQHRAKAACAVCHSKLDPLGFGLENFDAVGGWRDKDGGVAVDSSGTLPSGESFRGPGELKTILKAHTPQFTRCLTEKMLTYACRPWVGGIRPLRRRPDREGARPIVTAFRPSSWPSSKATHSKNGAIPNDRRPPRKGDIPVMRAMRLSRRTVLRGLGTAVALPWLEAMEPRRAMAAGPESPWRYRRRMAFFYVPNGVHLPDWIPAETGSKLRCRRRSSRSHPIATSCSC